MTEAPERTFTVTIRDNAAGTVETIEVADNEYYLLTTGSCYVDGIQAYPKSGTHVLTIKGRRGS